ncbi:nicotinamide-nucleotide amidohydrolase family protein [Chryseobacterium lacus]|uniref:Nicotinamide-nucleotide amidohydrolase family protein n=1 Tax=Chryseobacterium lacus TaxID=2058346 RepID=A0A368N5C9_9FLAO|nr:nicotinamide-nucleotide amidohydrolase family protein [Chryseobacterium lacus]RCU44761.1 nicotinamide-nucleotide amidohydrolase family protein [Chryseobacterium lacus]RST32424.1 nicotinamide-nucleotide amidohydrolase family protein [Chryseobacterium lacus]
MIDQKKLNQSAELMTSKKLTIAVAESCTSGLIQNVFSQAEDAMAFFQGGITAYNAGQKAKQLNINPIHAENCNSVSKEIAEKMALEVSKRFNSELGLAITGYAQPVPEQGIEDCFAFVSLIRSSEIMFSKRIKGDPKKKLVENQYIFIEKILDEIIKVLK